MSPIIFFSSQLLSSRAKISTLMQSHLRHFSQKGNGPHVIQDTLALMSKSEAEGLPRNQVLLTTSVNIDNLQNVASSFANSPMSKLEAEGLPRNQVLLTTSVNIDNLRNIASSFANSQMSKSEAEGLPRNQVLLTTSMNIDNLQNIASSFANSQERENEKIRAYFEKLQIKLRSENEKIRSDFYKLSCTHIELRSEIKNIRSNFEKDLAKLLVKLRSEFRQDTAVQKWWVNQELAKL